jgi:DNA repair ATPase RecN
MLLEITIKNIALIESLRIELAQGFNVLTGETGAGKSIVVDSVNLALGGRADRDMIRTGAEAGVPVIDLTAATEAFLAEIGDEASKPLFVWPVDNTHLKYEGAVKMAGFVAEGLKNLGGMYADLLAGPDEGAGK